MTINYNISFICLNTDFFIVIHKGTINQQYKFDNFDINGYSQSIYAAVIDYPLLQSNPASQFANLANSKDLAEKALNYTFHKLYQEMKYIPLKDCTISQKIYKKFFLVYVKKEEKLSLWKKLIRRSTCLY